MKKKSTSKSAFFNLRVLLASVLCLGGIFVALLGMGAFSSVFAQAKGAKNSGSSKQDAPGTQTSDVVHMVGPAFIKSLRDLPYVPNEGETGAPLMRYPHGTAQPEAAQPEYPNSQSLLTRI